MTPGESRIHSRHFGLWAAVWHVTFVVAPFSHLPCLRIGPCTPNFGDCYITPASLSKKDIPDHVCVLAFLTIVFIGTAAMFSAHGDPEGGCWKGLFLARVNTPSL